MRVRTNIISGENHNPPVVSPIEALNTALEWYQTANNVVQNALVDPEALKSFMNVLPPANQ